MYRVEIYYSDAPEDPEKADVFTVEPKGDAGYGMIKKALPVEQERVIDNVKNIFASDTITCRVNDINRTVPPDKRVVLYNDFNDMSVFDGEKDNSFLNYGESSIVEDDYFTGIGKCYFGARYYDPELGVWTSRDAAEQFYNGYGYHTNPVMYVDPDGNLFVLDDFLVAMAIGAIVSATINTGVQAYNIHQGNQKGWDWASFGGAVIGGAVGGGLGYMAPAFSGVTNNLLRYSLKAGSAAGISALSTGAGMGSYDLLAGDRVNFSGKEYLKAMGSSALVAGGISAVSSAYDYASWDRFSPAEKVGILKQKLGSDVHYEPFQDAYGKVVNINGKEMPSLNASAMRDRVKAFQTTKHELYHLKDLNRPSIINNSNLSVDQTLNIMERRAYKNVNFKTWNLPGRYLSEAKSVMRSEYGYSGISPLYSPFNLFFNVF